MDNTTPKIVQWILDTRPLWPVPAKGKRRDEVEELKTVVGSQSTPNYQNPANPIRHLVLWHCFPRPNKLAS
jgi:hypothetical protein